MLIKTWKTQRDEKVCPICAPLDGETVERHAPFSNGSITPPAHPNCRCTSVIENTPDTLVPMPQ